MGIRERYEHGVFCWVDLASTDQAAAKQFYGELLSWDFIDVPMGEGPPYSMAVKNQKHVAAIFTQPDAMQQQQIPPHWQSYINVDDVDATVEMWQQHGGTVIMPGFDVLDSGRMATVKDPTNAVVSLWQAKAHIGAELVNEINTFCWAELQTRGAEQAAQFYQKVLGWSVEVEEKPPNYVMCSVKGHLNCGMFDLDKINLPPEIPSVWAVYFNVADLDATLTKAKTLGGKAVIDPVTIDQGRFVTIADPQGATVALIELNNPDD